ncbi:MAG: hypothetical protein HKP61_10645 [Dactylosporangium sp.]|nr:hypothetical protein [Dactylosporangium sp.]
MMLELGTLLVMTGHGREATEQFARLCRMSGGGPEPSRILAGITFGNLVTMVPLAEWLPRLDRTAPQLRGGGDSERTIFAALAFAAAGAGDRPAGEVARLARLAAVGPLPQRDPWLLVNLASAALTIADQLPEAIDLLDRGIDAARRRGDVTVFGYLSMLRSHTAGYAGRLREAEADAWTAYEISRGRAQGRDPRLAAAVLVDVLVDRGGLGTAQEVLAGQDGKGDDALDMLIAHFVHVARARLRLAQGRPRDALADLRTCGERLITAGYLNPAFAHWRAEAALAHLDSGDPATAHEMAAEELRLARRFQAPRAVGVALRVIGRVVGGAEGQDHLREAVAVLDGSAAELERARALVDYGAAVRRSGQRIAARDALRRGLDLAARCGAQPLMDRATSELATAGARPRRAALSGAGALTAAEYRVAQLAAGGGTNRELAQALFITKRTVEVHLTNTYRKLGITSRRELRRALDQTPGPGSVPTPDHRS